MGRRARWVVVGAAILAVVALAVIVTGQLWLHGQHAADDRAVAVREAADKAVTAELSYDYRRLAAGRDETLPLLTGAARTEYDEVHAQVSATAPTLQAVVTAKVKASTVLEHDDSSARVLLFVDQLSSSKKLKQPNLDQSRVVVTLTREGDSWLVSSLAAI